LSFIFFGLVVISGDKPSPGWMQVALLVTVLASLAAAQLPDGAQQAMLRDIWGEPHALNVSYAKWTCCCILLTACTPEDAHVNHWLNSAA
jgi:hypothetical protein